MAVELDRVIPLPQAAKQMGMTVEALTRLVTSGKLKAMKTSSGEVVVPESETQSAITREQFKRLREVPITMAEASEKYGPSVATIWNWVKHGWIAKLDEAYPVHLNEQDVAYCVAIYEEKSKSGSPLGTPLFDKDGRPYMLKHPKLAEYRRKKARANKTQETRHKNGQARK